MGGNSIKVVFAPFWKGVYSWEKEFSTESKFFLFRADPFSEGDWSGIGMQEYNRKLQSCLIVKNGG